MRVILILICTVAFLGIGLSMADSRVATWPNVAIFTLGAIGIAVIERLDAIIKLLERSAQPQQQATGGTLGQPSAALAPAQASTGAAVQASAVVAPKAAHGMTGRRIGELVMCGVILLIAIWGYLRGYLN